MSRSVPRRPPNSPQLSSGPSSSLAPPLPHLPRRAPLHNGAEKNQTPPPGEGKQINNRDAAKSAELARD